MSYIVIKVYSFECDYPGCNVSNYDIHDPRGLRAAVAQLRKDGWTCRSGEHICPQHEDV